MSLFGSKKKKANNALLDSSLLVMGENTPFSVQEAYKALRTNVTFSMPGNECKIIGITSSDSQDGKSTTIINLSIAMAEAGKSVLLVDCDMRLPTISTKLGIPSTPGLSDFLIGEAKAGDLIQFVKRYEIDVIPSGTVPPDSTRLLESRQFSTMLATLKNHYDYILVDLPPVTVVADAAIVAKDIDGFILAVKHEHSHKRAVEDMINQMRFVGANILGIVYTNAPIAKKGGYYNYGYYK